MMADPATWLARAKINLTLHVTGQRSDGYHCLDSLVCFADVADIIRVQPDTDLTLRVDGPMRAGVPSDSSNLMIKAARLFDQQRGARISLEKHLPNAAGMGGGSADAAATLRALSDLWDTPIPDNPVTLGADVPVCLSDAALRMSGIGEALTAVPALPETWAVLANPGVPVHTPSVFKALTQKVNPAMPDGIPAFRTVRELAEWCGAQRNDLQGPAIDLAPVIGDVLTALRPSLLARMSGSGASCFGLCEDQSAACRLALNIRADHPDWWVMPTRLS